MNKADFIVVDDLENAEAHFVTHPYFEAAFKFLRETRGQQLETGECEIDGKKLYANVIQGELKAAEDATLEAHRKYLDIHFLRSEEEEISWQHVETCTPETDYDPEKDYLLFSDKPESRISLKRNQFAIIYPDAAHAPMIGSGPVDKIVVKVLIEPKD